MPVNTPAPEGNFALIEADDFFSKEGPMPTSYDEVRRFPRFYMRTWTQATIFPVHPEQFENPQQFCILTCNVSRGGVSILHCEQLFPGQRLDVVLNDASRLVEVQWCRYLAERCYLAGCQFVKQSDDAGEIVPPIV